MRFALANLALGFFSLLSVLSVLIFAPSFLVLIFTFDYVFNVAEKVVGVLSPIIAAKIFNDHSLLHSRR